MTAEEYARKRKTINKTVDKILHSRLDADTKERMIKAQRAKLRELREALS